MRTYCTSASPIMPDYTCAYQSGKVQLKPKKVKCRAEVFGLLYEGETYPGVSTSLYTAEARL